MPCIFCGSTAKYHKEHVLPKWMREEFGDDPTHQRVDFAERAIDDEHRLIRGRTTGSSIYEMQVSCVCQDCNNHWMSRVEGEAKGTLLTLMEGRDLRFTARHVRPLTRWLTLKTMVGEFLNRPSVRAINETQHRWFYTHRRPPATTLIWIGTCGEEGFRGLHLRHLAWTVAATEVEIRNIVQSNVQLTIWVLGRLVAYCFVSINPFDRRLTPESGFAQLLVPLFPRAGIPFDWPLDPLPYEGAIGLSTDFAKALERLSSIYTLNTGLVGDILR